MRISLSKHRLFNYIILRLLVLYLLYILIVRPVYNWGKADGRSINSDTTKEVIK